ESGVRHVTFYETTGWRGVMERESGSPLPEQFRSLPGAVFPLYHVLADAGEFSGGHVIRSSTSDPLALQCLALRRGERLRLLIANLSPEPREVTVHGLTGPARMRLLDETNAEEAMRDPEIFRKQ